MEIKTRKEKEAVVVSIEGRMDAVSSPEFEKKLAELMAEGEKAFIIDFGELNYISSSGLRSILVAAKELKAKDGQILLSALKGGVKNVFEISGFSSMIPIYESVEAALAQM